MISQTAANGFWIIYAMAHSVIWAFAAADMSNTLLDRPDIPTGKPPWLP